MTTIDIEKPPRHSLQARRDGPEPQGGVPYAGYDQDLRLRLVRAPAGRRRTRLRHRPRALPRRLPGLRAGAPGGGRAAGLGRPRGGVMATFTRTSPTPGSVI